MFCSFPLRLVSLFDGLDGTSESVDLSHGIPFCKLYINLICGHIFSSSASRVALDSIAQYLKVSVSEKMINFLKFLNLIVSCWSATAE